MSSSVQRELEEIEHRRKLAQMDNNGNRRGSSIFATVEDSSDLGPYGRPAYLTKPGDLLVDFPEGEAQSQTEYSQSDNASYMQNNSQHSDGLIISGRMMMSSAVDSYYGSSSSTSTRKLGREAARIKELENSRDLPGGINHRPLVGGFAAAAYEAAKSHHYDISKVDTRSTTRDRRPPPPSI